MPTRRVARNSLFVISSVLLGGILIFFTMILIARYLGVAEYGQFSFLLAIVSIIQLFADGGIVNITIRDIAVNKEKLLEHVGTTTIGLAIISLSMTSLVVLFLLWAEYDEQYSASLIIMLLAAFSALHGLVFGAAFRAMEDMHITSLTGIVHKVALTAIVGLAIILDTGLIGVAVAHLLANLGQAIALMMIASRKYGRIVYRADTERWRTVARDSIPLGVSMVLRKLTIHLDIMLLTLLASVVAVGLYSSAYRILQMIEVASIAFAGVLFPVFSKLADENREKLTSVFNNTMSFLLVVSAPIAIWFFLSAENLITIFYGEEFYPAYKVLQILGIALIFLIPAALIHPIFTAIHRQKILMFLSLGSLILNTVADLVLIPLYSYFGAAIGTAVTECIIFITGIVLLRRENIVVGQWKKLIGVIIAVFAGAITYRYLPDSPGFFAELFRFGVYIAVYGALILVLKVYVPADLKKLLAKPKPHSLNATSDG